MSGEYPLGAPCPACGTALDADQRYCLQCGERRGAPRVDVFDVLGLGDAPAPSAPPHVPGGRRGPSRLVVGALAAVVLAAGIAVGATVQPDPTPASAARAAVVPLDALTPPAPAPAPTATPAPQTTDDGGSAATDGGDDGDTTTEVTTDTDTAFTDSTDTSADTTPVETTPADTGDTDTGSDDTDDDSGPTAAPVPTTTKPATPAIDHVWVITLSRQTFGATFGPDSTAPYLGHELPRQGVSLSGYAPVSGAELANGVALLSGQAPNDATAQNCPTYTDVAPADVDATTGVAAGTGCIYPASAQTLADQLTGAGKTWRAYVEDQGTPCRRPQPGLADPWQAPVPADAALTPRDPFVYFHSIVDTPACAKDVVGLDALAPELADAKRTPAVSWIVPNACHDGRDTPCAPGAPAGVAAADAFLHTLIPQITATKAYRKGGLIVIAVDTTPWSPDPAAQLAPSGALLLSPFVRAGATVSDPTNAYGVLRSIEDLFALGHLAHAGDKNVAAFGDAVYAPLASAARTTTPTNENTTGRSK